MHKRCFSSTIRHAVCASTRWLAWDLCLPGGRPTGCAETRIIRCEVPGTGCLGQPTPLRRTSATSSCARLSGVRGLLCPDAA